MNISDKALAILRLNLDLERPAWREHKVVRSQLEPATDVTLTLNCGHFACVHVPDYYGPQLLVRDISEASVCTVCASAETLRAALDKLVSIVRVIVRAWASDVVDGTTQRFALLEL